MRRSASDRFDEGEGQDLTDGAAGDRHDQPVQADAQSAGRRHTELQCAEEVLVDLHRFRVALRGQPGLLGQPGTLDQRIGQLGVRSAQLHATGHQIPAFHQPRLAAMPGGQRRALLREVGVEGGKDRRLLDQHTVDLLQHRARTEPLLQVDVQIAGDLDQIVQIGMNADLAAELGRDGLRDRHDRPVTADIGQLQRAIRITQRQHRAPVHGDGGILDDPLGEQPHIDVVGQRLVGLHHGELRIVGVVDALVAEVASDLEDRAHAGHQQPFQGQFGRDAQHQIGVVGVDVRAEGTSSRPAVGGTQNRRLDLGESLVQQGLPHRRDAPAAGQQQIELGRIDEQIERAVACPRLRVGQSLPGHRMHRLGEHRPPGDQQGRGAVAGLPGFARGVDDVTGIDQLSELVYLVASERLGVEQQLQVDTVVGQVCETDSAVIADAAHPSGHRPPIGPGSTRFQGRQPDRCPVAHRVPGPPGRLERGQMCQPLPGLVGSP
ncbi:hypothetical protein SDC9_118141 [bioreactor metagenome]|uniref:Uncharacterized protein n=1 Tax=bioreactor metagenome TaxID=1076179 RepID=A0A645C1H3_9ZZZZ